MQVDQQIRLIRWGFPPEIYLSSLCSSRQGVALALLRAHFTCGIYVMDVYTKLHEEACCPASVVMNQIIMLFQSSEQMTIIH